MKFRIFWNAERHVPEMGSHMLAQLALGLIYQSMEAVVRLSLGNPSILQQTMLVDCVLAVSTEKHSLAMSSCSQGLIFQIMLR